MIFICYSKCSTCKGIEKTMKEKGLKFDKRDIKENNPQKDEIKEWHIQSKLPLKRFFNTSGLLYRELNLKDKINYMSDEEQYELLQTDGMLMKRPILLFDDQVLLGPDVKKYVESL